MGLLDGQPIELLSFVKNVMHRLINQKVQQIEAKGITEGIHKFELHHALQLPEGRLRFEEHSIGNVEFNLTFWYQLEKTLPKIIARFDVKDRGHYLRMEVPDHFKGPVQMIMVWGKPPVLKGV